MDDSGEVSRSSRKAGRRRIAACAKCRNRFLKRFARGSAKRDRQHARACEKISRSIKLAGNFSGRLRYGRDKLSTFPKRFHRLVAGRFATGKEPSRWTIGESCGTGVPAGCARKSCGGHGKTSRDNWNGRRD